MTGASAHEVWRAARQGWRREPPDRYVRHPDAGPDGFHRRVSESLHERSVVLDLGAGAEPVTAPGKRPAGCVWVGLDVSAAELARAPAGSYDEVVVTDAAVTRPELAGRFDVVVSLFALEHVDDLAATLANAGSYLRPQGRLLAYLSGRNSVPSMLNRALPSAVSGALVARLTDRDRETVHPARYDRCAYRQLLEALGDDWASREVVACYWGEKYFRFSRPLHAVYAAYEEVIASADRRQLATHYLLDAVRR